MPYSVENGIKVDKSEDIAQKIAKLLETEKCTVSESQYILHEAETIINDSTFTVRDSKQAERSKRIRAQKSI